MDFRVLGPLEVEIDGRSLTPTRPRERAVLALLLLRAGRVVGADELIDAVWGEEPPATARTALHGVISSLRRRLGEDRIETRAPGYRLAVQAGDRYDMSAFEELTSAAARDGPLARSRLLEEALALFRGEPLADVDLPAGLQHEVARLHKLRLGANEAKVGADLELGRHTEVIPTLELLVADQPLREGLRSQLMLALYRAGRQADALRVAQDGRHVLAHELGVEPGPTLQRLERQILDHDPALMDEGVGLSGDAATALQLAELAAAGATATFLAVHSGDPGTRQLMLAVAARHGAVEVPSRPGTMLGFGRARDAAIAAAAMQRSARRGGPGLQLGLHSATHGAGVDVDMDRALRHAAVAHPGQVILSSETRDLLREAPLHEVDARDVGAHRLTDLGPERPLYQLVALGLEVDFPPIVGLESRPTNLPVQPTPLVGRQEEVRLIAELLRDPEIRLVTLTGAGGTGKTRLAVHAAAELLDDASDGTWFVALDSLADPTLVAPTIATTLGIGQAGGAPLESLALELGEGRILLVLDNFEHLLSASTVVADLLAATSTVKVLVTSRVPLKVDAERVVTVPPLAAPPAEMPLDVPQLLGISSVALFVAVARAARPGFALTPDNAPAVTQLCRALDGLPLAIELAASQVGLVPPSALVGRLDRSLRRVTRAPDVGPIRHRALDATIEWSYDLLDTAARNVFIDAAVFAGGWTLDAAESVCDGARDVIAGLATLVDHSLVRVDGTEPEPRFGMLETIRERAARKLDSTGRRPDVERRHAMFFQALAESAEPHLRGNPGVWVARLEREHDNLRAALDRRATTGDSAGESRLAGALWRFWYLAGHLVEGRRRLEHALASYGDPSPARAKALIGAAVMAVNTDDPAAARERAEEAIELCRALGDAWGAAYAQFMLGAALSAVNDGLGARSAEEASLRAFRELGDEHSALLVSRNLAGTLEDLGDRAGAVALYQDNLRRARAERNGRLEASTLGALAMIAFDEGRLTDAALMLRESLRLHRELADRLDTAVDLSRAARLLAMSGHPETAARVIALLAVTRDQLGARGRAVAATVDATSAALRRQLSDGIVRQLMREGEALTLDDAVEAALTALA